MSLANLIRGKSAPDRFATATPATVATQEGGRGQTVASVATVAVAKSPRGQAAPPAKVSTADPATASRLWLLHYPDRDPLEVSVVSGATRAEMLAWHPDAVAVEPYTPTLRQASAPMTASEEAAVRAWLALIEETDPAMIAEVIERCQRDGEARDYFTGRAAVELPKPDPFRAVRCGACQNFRVFDYHPALGSCAAGVEPGGAAGWWGNDRHVCEPFIALTDDKATC